MTYTYRTADAVSTAGERAVLESFLDHFRISACAKVTDISDEDARRRLVASETTLAGLLKHLRRVEMSWFQQVLAQVPKAELPELMALTSEPDADFRVHPDETIRDLVHAYERECDASRRTAAQFTLDHVVPHPRLGAVSLRWIYVHMIEETARHVGHADILREQIDGSTGDVPPG